MGFDLIKRRELLERFVWIERFERLQGFEGFGRIGRFEWFARRGRSVRIERFLGF